MGKEGRERRKGERNLKGAQQGGKAEAANNKPFPPHATHGCRLAHKYTHAPAHIR